MTPAAQALLTDLEAILAQAPTEWRRAALLRIVDLFLHGAESYGDDHVAIFDEVMCRLIKDIDRAVLAEVSTKLAPVDNAPSKVVGTLARHVDTAIHGPVLEQAKTVSDEDLVAIANRDRIDPRLLNRIADRPTLSEAVTDILLRRGNAAIQRKIIDNPNARVSEAGFARIVLGVNGNKPLAAAIAARDDVPAELRVWLDKTLAA